MRFREIKLKTELSVFFALVLVVIASLLLNITEAARTQGARTYYIMAADSAVDSLFSQYHRKLWEDYRLLGLEMYSQKEITEEFYVFLEPYLKEAENWYALDASKEETSVVSYELLTDKNGEVLRRELLDYMKYGLVLSVPELSDMLEFKDILKDSTACSETSSEYSFCSEEAEEMERILTELSESILEHNTLAGRAQEALNAHDSSGFKEASSDISGLLSEIRAGIDRFDDAADRLAISVMKAEENFEARFASGELSRESYELLKSELTEYRNYSDESGELRIKISKIRYIADEAVETLDETERMVSEAEEYLDSYVPDEVIVGYRPSETEGGEPIPIYEKDEPDADAAYAPAISCFSSYPLIESPVVIRNPDKEKKEKLDSVRELLAENMLSLILPEDYEIPGIPLDLTEKPSSVYPAEESSADDGTLLSDRIFVTEYIMQMLNAYSEDSSSEKHLEAEYVICGEDTDSENLSGVVSELIAIRTGLDLIFLLKDTEKREAALQLSLAITGLASATPLSTVMFLLILSTWAFAQAVLDVKDLLHGSGVPVMHSSQSFYLSLEGLLSDFKNIVKSRKEGTDGLTYREYLRLLLFLHMDAVCEYRILDVIQMNLRKTQPDFLVRRLYTGIQLETEAVSSHIFQRGKYGTYSIKVKTHYSY